MQTYITSSEELLRYYANHVVTFESTYELSVKDGEPSTPHLFVASAFVVSIKDRWFFMTAGHIFPQLKAMRDQGTKFGPWQLCDIWGLDRQHRQSVTIDFENLIKVVYYDPKEDGAIATQKSGIDYAALTVRPYYVRLMLANKIRPIDSRGWGSLEEEYDQYFMLGVPAQLSELTARRDGAEQFKRALVYIPLTRHDVPPPGMERKYTSFYGKIKDSGPVDSEVTDIAGMSGGPIFGINYKENRYAVVAIQSAWNPKTHDIVGVSMIHFAMYLEEKLRIELDKKELDVSECIGSADN